MANMRKHLANWSLLLLTLAIICAGAVIGQPAPPPSGTSAPIGGQPTPDEAGHILRLHQEHVRTQQQILDLQSSEIARLEKEKPEGKDENGGQARKQMNRLHARLRHLKGQLDTIMAKRPPLPPDVARQVGRLHELGFEQAQQMRRGFERIRQLVPNEAKDELPKDQEDQEETSLDKGTTDETEENVPENQKEAADVIGTGKVKTPTHLLKLFERVHTNKTPRSNLSYYKRYRSRK